ncbi:LysE/ArgO family amino acid transporter [Campylobacter vicugnae]|uniref:Transporter, LysE family n=1 Tax=Campylobacter vicugnae TaxID=1660076 RepID=A0A1X9T2F2_9BACT|nr:MULTISPECIES: LysE family transporter [Campylobacter]ARR02651.1 transporter, LysE family [Campylobacter sp. RM8964]MDL0107456.1 LysE family transporter [Campylobacter ovis]
MQNFIFLKGFFLSLSLIMAIGAQNAFVLRQGIAKNNVFYVCLVCFLCDFVLILAGIFGVGEVIAKNVIVNVLITALGILFVSYYAITALISAFSTKNSVIFEIEHSNFSIKKTIILTLCITLLNPHVYLDTVFVVGASALTFDMKEKIIFALGSLSASFIWFFSLGFGAKKFSHFLSKPIINKIIDIFIAIIMFFVVLTLVKFLLKILEI